MLYESWYTLGIALKCQKVHIYIYITYIYNYIYNYIYIFLEFRTFTWSFNSPYRSRSLLLGPLVLALFPWALALRGLAYNPMRFPSPHRPHPSPWPPRPSLRLRPSPRALRPSPQGPCQSQLAQLCLWQLQGFLAKLIGAKAPFSDQAQMARGLNKEEPP